MVPTKFIAVIFKVNKSEIPSSTVIFCESAGQVKGCNKDKRCSLPKDPYRYMVVHYLKPVHSWRTLYASQGSLRPVIGKKKLLAIQSDSYGRSWTTRFAVANENVKRDMEPRVTRYVNFKSSKCTHSVVIVHYFWIFLLYLYIIVCIVVHVL